MGEACNTQRDVHSKAWSLSVDLPTDDATIRARGFYGFVKCIPGERFSAPPAIATHLATPAKHVIFDANFNEIV